MHTEFAPADRTVSAAQLALLRARVDGTVVGPQDREYSGLSRIWNRAKQVPPALIVRCTHAQDIAIALEFARGAGLPIAVRGGGHSPAGMCSTTGLVLDLRPMRHVSVDPLGRVAVVAAGATWGILDAATQRHGYAIPGVPGSNIGVAGSTLGGGFGHLRRAYGLACDSLIGADLVAADGSVITTSGDEHPELLWGLRGGGGNFGVVTSMRFRLQPLPEPVLSGPVVFAAAKAADLMRFYREYTADLREDVTTRLMLVSAPRSTPTGPSPRPVRTVPVVAIAATCVGHPADSQRLVLPIRSAGPVLVDRLRAQPYAQLQASRDDAHPSGRFAAVTSMYVDELDEEVIAAVGTAHSAMPRGACEIHVQHMGGAVGRVPRMSTAVPNRASAYLLTVLTRWDDPSEEHPNLAWFEAAQQRLETLAVGGPHVGLTSEPASSVSAYGAERYLRLAALKRRFDPDNVFAGNQNVVPLA